MDDSNDDLGDVVYAGKLKLNHLNSPARTPLKRVNVMPATKLAQTKELGFIAFVFSRQLLQTKNTIKDWAVTFHKKRFKTCHLLGECSKGICIIFQHKVQKASLANTLISCKKNSYFFSHM